MEDFDLVFSLPIPHRPHKIPGILKRIHPIHAFTHPNPFIFDEPKCFDSMMAHYGKFSGVENYIALVGKKGIGLEEGAGYYGEKIVLKAQELGLNTCWVAMTHGKSASDRKVE